MTPMPNTAQLPLNAGGMKLNNRQKAAVIVRLAIANGADIKLRDLPPALQRELVHQLQSLKHIDQDTIAAVVDEFVARFDAAGLSFPSALSDAISMLDDVISPDVAIDMRRQAGISLFKDPWARISDLDSAALANVIEHESVEVAAVILSKLKTSKAAEILSQVPGDRARRIAYAISLTGTIAPKMVEKIGHTIAEQLDAKPALAFSDGPVERVGAILNFSTSATRDDVLDGLDQEDATFASEVRKAIFTFANIPERIDPRDIPKVLREIDGDLLILALAGATGSAAKTREFILENMSKRMAEQLQEDVDAKGEVKQSEAEAAMTDIIVKIRELEAAGEIFLIAADEE